MEAAGNNKQLKVGELARSTGLTVRTLHHYDEIDLLKPSGRSESGYRLYSQTDIERLHAIQALRHLGLPLNDIAGLLDGQDAQPALILEQQIQALDRQIEQARELRGRLALIRDGIATGKYPDMGDWLHALSMMAALGKYFSADELKAIFTGWKKIEDEWLLLMQDVRAVMEAGAQPDSPEVQPLARRWMALVHHWMDGDFELMYRWRDAYRAEPSARVRHGAPPTDMNEFMQQAIDVRMALLRPYFDEDDMRRIGYVPEARWRELEADVRRLLGAGVDPASAEARAPLRRWQELMNQLSRGDAALLAKMLRMLQGPPLLLAGSPLSPAVRGFLRQALQKSLDPHAT